MTQPDRPTTDPTTEPKESAMQEITCHAANPHGPHTYVRDRIHLTRCPGKPATENAATIEQPATTDPTTDRMRQETGHDCIACPTNVRNLMATVHNAVGALQAAQAGTGSWERAWRKVEGMRAAEARMQPIAEAHFEALYAWRRP